VRGDFSTTYEDFIGSIPQPFEMASYIRAVREQYAIKMFAYLTEKFHSAYSPYALNEVNLALTQYILAQHEKI
jgi:hypothetical protein